MCFSHAYVFRVYALRHRSRFSVQIDQAIFLAAFVETFNVKFQQFCALELLSFFPIAYFSHDLLNSAGGLCEAIAEGIAQMRCSLWMPPCIEINNAVSLIIITRW